MRKPDLNNKLREMTMRTRITALLIGIVAGVLGCDGGGSSSPAVSCAECGNGSLDCDGDVAACMTAECVVTGTSLGETVTLNAGHYTLVSPNGTVEGTFTVTADSKGIVLTSSADHVASELGVYTNTCPYSN